MTLTSPLPTPRTDATLAPTLARNDLNLVGGRWQSAHTGATTALHNPSDTREVLGHVPDSDPADVHEAVMAAQRAWPAWAATPAPVRADVLMRALAWLEARQELWAQVLSWEEGKPLAESRIEVGRALRVLAYMAGEGRRMGGRTIPCEQPGVFAYTTRRPLGVVGLITPWNFPVAIPAWKLAPALVAGNAVVLKPAVQTPYTAHLLVQAFVEAGLPPGVLNVVHGGARAGEALVEHPDVQGLSFTGSTAVGKRINLAAAGRLAKVQLELGGKNAAIVLADADLESAASLIAQAAWGSTGQRCTSTSRVLVVPEVRAALVDLLAAEAARVRVGPGLDETSTMGPLIDMAARDRVLARLREAERAGVRRVAGGTVPDGELAPGAFMTPTLLTGVKPEHAIAREEVFGPVLAVMPVRDLDEAIAVQNSVAYGLTSTLFTRDLDAALGYAQRADTGMLHVNCSTYFSEIHLPFGGTKESGFGGREMGETGIEFYTEGQTVYMRGRA